MSVKIDGYLTQDKLSNTLQTIIGKNNWIGEEIRVPDTMKRWDMMFNYNNKIYIVEFDGDQHFRDSLIIKSDNEKDKIALKLNYITIRIPYFIQLTDETFKIFFNFENNIKINSNFPHGFHDKKAKLPASFCPLGILRYKSILEKMSHTIILEIEQSLIVKAKELDNKYVYF